MPLPRITVKCPNSVPSENKTVGGEDKDSESQAEKGRSQNKNQSQYEYKPKRLGREGISPYMINDLERIKPHPQPNDCSAREQTRPEWEISTQDKYDGKSQKYFCESRQEKDGHRISQGAIVQNRSGRLLKNLSSIIAGVKQWAGGR